MQAKQWLAAKLAKKDTTADEELLQLVPQGRAGSHEQASSSRPGPVAGQGQGSSMVHAVVSHGLAGRALSVRKFVHPPTRPPRRS